MLFTLEDGVVGLLYLLFLNCLVFASFSDNITLGLGLFDDILCELLSLFELWF